MIEQTYANFLTKQKKIWLEKKSKGKEPSADLIQEANERYTKDNWMHKAIKQARFAITTHTSTFTHPDAKSSCFFYQAPIQNNGFLSTNNVQYQQTFDVFGNAATDSFVKEIYLFLIEPIQDQSIWEHVKNESSEFKKLTASLSLKSDEVKSALSKLMIDPENAKTHPLLKQVYFPINNDYHLLSLLTPSVVTTELLNRLNKIRFNDITKEARTFKKENKFHPFGFDEIFNLTEIALGGSKPQNVSVLNSQNAGRAYLLSSCPPALEKRSVRLPNSDFFTQCLYRKNHQNSFIQLHQFMQLDINNINIRNAIDNILQFVIDEVLLQGLKIRETYPSAWSTKEHYASLPKIQRIWLDDIHADLRENDTQWRTQLSIDIARWITRSYEKAVAESYDLGSAELLEIQNLVEKSLQKAREFF
ncbi:type I-F CRISPR-associated protein Csy1 [Vitreoscilla stercoraria]|uniref:Type I-F CRISPR-associated protein Csy1 n=1 Tax=Vitreoscilla stercoraria TaxID=61 RepID=A0ABY4E7M0_VITST|nr:type I-F CRISPR-associated protein Csy1 [Vitreoscilla stercoraria]UOO91333.1 type I-F CRISPR-associated protein Csy1 [Vitreoscilla stercoraria]